MFFVLNYFREQSSRNFTRGSFSSKEKSTKTEKIEKETKCHIR